MATSNNTNANALQYVQLDYQSHYDSLVQRIQARYPAGWNDFYTGNFGTIFLDIAAWSLATQAYTINRLVAENFISTLQLRESAVRLGNLVNYDIAQPTPSVALCAVSLGTPASEPVTLAAGTPIKTGTPSQTFEVLQNYTIPAGALFPQSLVTTFNPNIPSPRTVASLLNFTNGSTLVNCLDTTVNLQAYVSVGQVVAPDDGSGVTDTINAINADINGNYDIIQLVNPWTGNTGAFTASIYEQRVALVQGQTYTTTQVAPVNTATMSVALAASPVIDGSASVNVAGTAWTETTSLGLNGPTDNVFQVVQIPSSGTTVLLFGDGTRGALVPSQANVTISYRVGGGLVGNVASGAIDTSVPVTGVNTGSQYQLIILNQQAASGGTNAESLESARQGIPASTITGQRAVTLTDYQTLAGQFTSSVGSVNFARAVTRGGNTFLEGNLVIVYAWTTAQSGGLTPVEGPLKSALQSYLQSVAVATDYVLMADGSSQALPFACQIAVSAGSDPDNVAEAVELAVDTYVDSLVPGVAASFAQLIQTVLNTTGVTNAVVATPTSDVYPANLDTVFIAPSGTIAYTPELLSSVPTSSTTSASTSFVVGQLPFAPGFAWALTGTYGGLPVYIGPDVNAGFATISGVGLDTAQDSVINLATGVVNLYIVGVSQTLNLYLTPVQAYTLQRPTDIYVSYDGDNSQAQRQQVRAALQAWARGLSVGAPLYAVQPPTVSGPTPVSALNVVENIPGLSNVSVSLNSPSNPSPRLDVNETELVTLRQVYVNGLSN